MREGDVRGWVSPEGLTGALSWRYATQRFDPARRIEPAMWRALEASMVLAPSSYGLQPWRFVVVEGAGVKERLREASWGQPQVAECSHYVVFCRRVALAAGDVDRHLSRVAEVRGTDPAGLAAYRSAMLASIASPSTLPGGGIEAWTRGQVYLALGQFLLAAAVLGVDACPMEGFDPAAYDRVLNEAVPGGMDGYASVVAAAAGFRSAADEFAAAPKVRFDHGEVVKRV
jgi:nitroreductase